MPTEKDDRRKTGRRGQGQAENTGENRRGRAGTGEKTRGKNDKVSSRW